MNIKKLVRLKDDSEVIVKDFLNQNNKLSRQLKLMPVNLKTEEILNLLHSLAEDEGVLTEQMVSNALTHAERAYLNSLDK